MNNFEKRFLLDIHDKIYQIAKDDVELTRKLQQLAFGILVDIDGESAYLPPFELIPVGNDSIEIYEDIAGNLHNNFYKIIQNETISRFKKHKRQKI